MRKIVHILLAPLILAAIPQFALACRIERTPKSRIAESYDAVVVATILTAEPNLQFQKNGLPTWTATAKLMGTLNGESRQTKFVINKPENVCEPGQSIAVIGETWILYLRNNLNGTTVAASYPLSFARNIDKRFTGQP